jgi:hypothetical protein
LKSFTKFTKTPAASLKNDTHYTPLIQLRVCIWYVVLMITTLHSDSLTLLPLQSSWLRRHGNQKSVIKVSHRLLSMITSATTSIPFISSMSCLVERRFALVDRFTAAVTYPTWNLASGWRGEAGGGAGTELGCSWWRCGVHDGRETMNKSCKNGEATEIGGWNDNAFIWRCLLFRWSRWSSNRKS